MYILTFYILHSSLLPPPSFLPPLRWRTARSVRSSCASTSMREGVAMWAQTARAVSLVPVEWRVHAASTFNRTFYAASAHSLAALAVDFPAADGLELKWCKSIDCGLVRSLLRTMAHRLRHVDLSRTSVRKK